MGTAMYAGAIDDARSIELAARAVLRAISSDSSRLDVAVDRLEVQAVRVMGDSVDRFDTAGAEPTEDDLLALAAATLGVGTTLLAAEAAIESPARARDLESAVAELEGTADSLEREGAQPTSIRGFDTGAGDAVPDVRAAARAALDDMAGSAADVATAILDRTLRPIVERVPESVQSLAADVGPGIGGRLARWGLRAVQRGLDLLRRLVDLDAIERLRARIDGVLARLGRGEDAAVLAGWAIGADVVRDELADGGSIEVRPGLAAELGQLGDRFGKLCRMLRRVAVAVTALSATLALMQVTLPHATTISVAGLILVLGATIAIGRDYTGAADIPGPVRGVRILLRASRDIRA